MWKYGRHPLRLGEEIKKKKKERRKKQDENITVCPIPYGDPCRI